jgi:hypothetical protein
MIRVGVKLGTDLLIAIKIAKHKYLNPSGPFCGKSGISTEPRIAAILWLPPRIARAR